MMLWKCSTQYASKFEKLSSGRRTGKGPFSSQSQRKAMPKNAQTTTQLYSSHTLVKQCSKFASQAWRIVNHELPGVAAGFRKGRITRDQIANICWIMEKAREFQKKHLFLLYWLCQSFWLCGSQETVENSERDGNTRPPDLPLEKPVCRSGGNS